MADLTQQILQFASKGPAKLEENDRLALLDATRKLSEALENPLETFLRLFLTIYDPIVLRIAVDLKLVDIALANGGTITLADFAEQSKADAKLLQRVLRMLIGLNIFTESSEGTYATTATSPLLATGSPFVSATVHITHLYHSVAAMPEYFAKNGYQNPTDALDGPFNLAHDCKGLTYFDFIAKPENDRLSIAFNETMEMQKSANDDSFHKTYPASERLKIDDPERVLFVDVGGSMGHQVRKFAELYPTLAGKLVLEDLPQVIEKAVEVPGSIKKVGHDFFQPQPAPVKNAKAFYLRMILHDWPEKQARIILTHIVDAMADDSLVLIHEAILPESGVAHLDAKMDWHMMTMGASERTEKQWNRLAESVGLEVKGIWWDEQGLGRRGLIEMGKKS